MKQYKRSQAGFDQRHQGPPALRVAPPLFSSGQAKVTGQEDTGQQGHWTLGDRNETYTFALKKLILDAARGIVHAKYPLKILQTF